MPCDELATAVAKVLDPQIRLFESSVARTADEVRGLLVHHEGSLADREERIVRQLGAFGSSYVNTERYVELFQSEPAHDPNVGREIEKALATFDELAKAECEFFVARVEPDGSLYETTRGALARTGRAFGAARLVHALESGRMARSENGVLTAFSFDKWNANERKTAPPLIVEVDGNDLKAASLGEFMDGTQKIVLVVRGPCSPAPLSRLVSPGTFVVQCSGVDDLAAFASFEGPGVAAIVPDDCALFMHDPDGGTNVGDRLTVTRMPKTTPRKPIGGLSGTQQNEELQILVAMQQAQTDTATPAKEEKVESQDPVDKLAAWLLTQADIPEPS